MSKEDKKRIEEALEELKKTGEPRNLKKITRLLEKINIEENTEEDKELKYKPVFVDLNGDIEFSTVIITEEPAEKLNKEIDKAIFQVKEDKDNWCVDDVLKEIENRVDLVKAEKIGEMCLYPP